MNRIIIFCLLAALCPSLAEADNVTPQPAANSPVALRAISAGGYFTTLEAEVGGSLSSWITDGADPSGSLVSSGTLWAVPHGTAQVQAIIEDYDVRALDESELAMIPEDYGSGQAQELVSVSAVMKMRGVSITTIAVNPLQPSHDGNSLVVYERVQFRLEYIPGGSMPPALPLPQSFYEVMRGVVQNLDEIVGEPDRFPEPYLIITPPGYIGNALDNFATWKRQRGHDVTIATTDETGQSAQLILNYLQGEYNSENPPVFVMLVGDVDGTNPMPCWMVEGYHTATIASDHLYTQLDGDDFLPDVLIGRLSVDSPFELQTVVNKIIGYERTPYLPDGAWRSRMAIVGVRSTPQQFLTYNSAWPTLRWVGNEFLNSGYAEIDSVPYPGGQASQVNAAINEGLSFLSYRGFGSPSDWAYPHYTIGDISGVENGAMLPVITSIVCGGGAFAHTTDPCFGEVWLRKGTPSAPGGAIGFIGPSELDTKTRWNNTNTAGIYTGILHEGVNTLSGAMLRGKMELLRQFPNNVGNHDADANTSVSFYFRCYNLLGDPGLNFFVGPARPLNYAVENDPQLGTPSVSITVSGETGPLRDVWATILVNDDVFSRAISDASGSITLLLPQAAAGSYEIALTKPRHEPQIFDLVLQQAGVVVGASEIELFDDGNFGSSGNGDGKANPGERLAMQVDLTNYGSLSYDGGALELETTDDRLNLITTSQTVDALTSGASQENLLFLADVTPSAAGEYVPTLRWTVTNSASVWQTTIDFEAPELSVIELYTETQPLNPEPGMTQDIQLVLMNNGQAEMPEAAATLISFDPRVQVVQAASAYPVIAAGQSAVPSDAGFEIQVDAMYPGESLPVQILLSAETVTRTIDYLLPIGNLSDSDPTPPDAYGYRAFESGDNAYPEAPDYSWLEIDPSHGGPGSILPLTDIGPGYDATQTVDLPFPFQYYGNTYTQISICTNGFVAMGETGESFFRNYQIPAIASPARMICPFWDDLITVGGRICTYFDSNGGRFVIEWSDLKNQYGTNPNETFQLILFDTECWPTTSGDGDILIQYHTLNNMDAWDNYATIGMQDRNAGYSMPLSYAGIPTAGVGALRSGQSILMTTGRAISGPYADFDGVVIDDDDEGSSSGNGDGIAQNGETIELSIQLANIGTEELPAATGALSELDPLVELLTADIQFPAIPAGETGVGSPATIILSPAIPDNYSVNLSLSFGEGTQPCVVLPAFTVQGPVLLQTDLEIDDDETGSSSGNGNGEFNPGETIELWLTIANSGQNIAEGVTATLSRQNANIQIQQGEIIFGDIEPDEEIASASPFVGLISQSVGNAWPIEVTVTLTDNYGTSWSQAYSYIVAETILDFEEARVEDTAPGGNDDGWIQPGETVEAYLTFRNRGISAATDVEVEILSVTDGVTVETPTLLIGTVSGNSRRESDTPLILTVSNLVDDPSLIRMTATAAYNGDREFQFEITLIVGNAIFYDDFETQGEDQWSTYGTHGLWHLQSDQYASPSSAYYCGDEQTGLYPSFADAYLRSPTFRFEGYGTLVVSTRYDVPDHADHARIHLQTGITTYQFLTELDGTNLEWHQVELPLDGLPPAQEARIRFWFESNASNQGIGWFIDDVLLLTDPTPVTDQTPAEIPQTIRLAQNYPNPFNDQTTLTYSIPQRTQVKLTLFDIQGRRVAELVDKIQEPGNYELGWKPISMASGIYFVRLEAAGANLIRKIVYLR